jgi:hypothetical protein
VFNFFQVHELTIADDLTQSDKLKKFVTGLVSNDFKELSKMMGEFGEPMDAVSGIIYLTFRQVIDVINKMDLLRAFGL